MMRCWVAVAALMLAAPAAAKDAPYAHKAGVTLAEHSADMARCLAAAKAAQQAPAAPKPYVDPAINTTPAGRAKLGGWASEGLVSQNMFRLTYKGCLTKAGYSQRAWPEADRKAMMALPNAEQPAAFEAMIGAPAPRHPEYRDNGGA